MTKIATIGCKEQLRRSRFRRGRQDGFEEGAEAGAGLAVFRLARTLPGWTCSLRLPPAKCRYLTGSSIMAAI